MKTPIFKAISFVLVSLLATPVLTSSAEAQAKPAPNAQAQKEKVQDVVKKPVKSRKLPIIYSAKDGDKVLKYIFKPKAKPGGRNVLVVWGVRGTKAADLKAVKKGSPAYAKMIADKKKERARRARAARLLAEAKKKVSAAETQVKFTSDEEQMTGGGSEEASSGDNLDQLGAALGELGDSADSEDPEVYDSALEKVITEIQQAKKERATAGDSESEALLQSLEDDLIRKESIEGTEEDEEEGFELEDEEE